MQCRLLSAAIVFALSASTSVIAAAPGAGTSVKADFARSSGVVRAQGLLDGPAAGLVRRAAADGFTARDATIDSNGVEHVRFDRTYRGLPVIGGDFVLHSRNGAVTSVSQTLRTAARPNLLPGIGVDRAIVEAGTRFGSGFDGIPNARLVVYARGETPKLAYEVRYTGLKADQTPTDMRYYVDAGNGAILDHWDTVQTAKPGPDPNGCTTPLATTGTGNALYLGTVSLGTSKCGTRYQMLDPTRGGGYTTNMANRTSGNGTLVTDADNVWGNGLVTDSVSTAVDAHYGVSKTWDYYKQTFGRNGIANDGKGAFSRVHYGRNYGNAFWSDNCFCMTFGDGNGRPLVALDVAGHEMSHGVTSRTAALVYSGESGGLNEATSDIFGTMVEYFANDSKDPGDYLIGEKIYSDNGTLSLRYMFKPSLDHANGDNSADCYSSSTGGLDVHYSSGIANHFFYLLAEGAVVPTGFGAGTSYNLTPASLVCNGNTAITGIGRDAAARIWYLALTTYMTSSTNYAGARAATLSAATDLYGATSTQRNAVAAAWSAVSVN